jgi:tetratricopeptide (TPR) repeat protein
MWDDLQAAIDAQDYQQAARMLKQWQQQTPQDPWLLLGISRYYEVTGKLEKAGNSYRKLIQTVSNPKVITQARQGIDRVNATAAAQREAAKAQAKAAPGSDQPGLLFLEAVTGEARKVAAQGLAKVMQLDPYVAGVQLPGKSPKLYRLGQIGELSFYQQSLQAAQTPAFCLTLADLKAPQVFRVQYIRSVLPQVAVICQSETGQVGTISFEWSEVTQQVGGMVPIFEQVVDVGPWGKMKRKERTQDYAHLLDLHLHGRGCILRFCDRTYQFQQGNPFEPPPADQEGTVRLASSRVQWNQLRSHLQQHLRRPLHNDFTQFGQGALEFIELMPSFASHIDLFRRDPCNWDEAFQLYSALIFARHQPQSTAALQAHLN